MNGFPNAIPASMLAMRTGSSLEITNAAPRRKNSMPSVAMNELIPTTTTKKVLIAPINSPVNNAAMMPSARLSMLAITTPATARVLATARSNSPMRITAVSPRRNEPDQGNPAKRHLIGREDDRLGEPGGDADHDQQGKRTTFGPPRQGRAETVEEVAALLPESDALSLAHIEAAFLASASIDTAATISAPIAIC